MRNSSTEREGPHGQDIHKYKCKYKWIITDHTKSGTKGH